MNEVIIFVFIIMGLFFAIFYKMLANKSVEFYKKFFNSKFSIIVFRIGFLLVGIAFIIFSFLAILNIIKLK